MNVVTATTSLNRNDSLGFILLPDAPRYTIVACTSSCLHSIKNSKELLQGNSLFDVEWSPSHRWLCTPANRQKLTASLQRAVFLGRRDHTELDAQQDPMDSSTGAAASCRKWLATQTPFDSDTIGTQYIVHFLEPERTPVDAEKDKGTGKPGPSSEVARMSSLVQELQVRMNHIYSMQTEFTQTAQRMRNFMSDRSLLLQRIVGEQAAVDDRERRALARDLHDDLAQTLTAARMKLFSLGKNVRGRNKELLSDIESLIGDADRATRSLASQLMPPMLYELGLVPALQWLCEEMQRRYGLHVTFLDDGMEKPLSQDARAILYRAIRELLINAAKHAKVDKALVASSVQGSSVVIMVSDDGVGFDSRIVSAGRANRYGVNLGLASIPERVAFLGGHFSIESRPGHGTAVKLTAPLQL